MKGSYKGVMSVEDFFQDRSFFEEHGITHIRSAGLYFTPCNEKGKEVIIRDDDGRTIDGYETAGCYHSAADSYDGAEELEPKVVRRSTTGKGGRGGGKGGARRCKPG